MKYQAKQLANGQWAVWKNSKAYWASTTTRDRETAEISAAGFSASWHLEQAQNLLDKMDLPAARNIGHEANDIVYTVENRCRNEDPDYDERDPRGWLA